ncbi:MAG TPA: hypothetical protein PLP04_01900, partial [Bryobacteraceae bacterium]|nr:hypothetical protein [Bryobacteraceae bacterium]
MTRPSACRCALPLLIFVSAAALRGAVLPASTELEIRLKTRVASNASRPDDPVEAVLIRPVVVGGEIAVPAGVTLRGRVKEALAISKPDQRAVLGIEFFELGGVK